MKNDAEKLIKKNQEKNARALCGSIVSVVGRAFSAPETGKGSCGMALGPASSGFGLGTPLPRGGSRGGPVRPLGQVAPPPTPPTLPSFPFPPPPPLTTQAKARKGIERLSLTVGRLESVEMQLREQYGAFLGKRSVAPGRGALPPPHPLSLPFPLPPATVRVAGTLSKSVDIMRSMGQLMRAPEVMASMRTMGAEMTKAGLIQELVDEAMENAMPVETDEVDDVVDQVLWEVTKGSMGKAPPAGVGVGAGVSVEAVVAEAAGAGRVAEEGR